MPSTYGSDGSVSHSSNSDNNGGGNYVTRGLNAIGSKLGLSGTGSSNTPDKNGAVGNFRDETGKIGSYAMSLNGIDPTKDSSRVTADGRTVYTSSNNPEQHYSFGMGNMPYSSNAEGVANGTSERIAGRAAGESDAEYTQRLLAAGINPAAAGEAEKSNVESAVERYNEVEKASGIGANNKDIQKIVDDPNAYLDKRDLTVSDKVPMMDPNKEGTGLNPNDPRYSIGQDVTYGATQVEADTFDAPNKKPVAEYQVDTSADRLDAPQFQVDPVTGEIRDQNLVDAEAYVLDMQGAGTGVNADGTTNHTGQALNDYASQNVSMMIDTSTSSGKLLAQKLGEGNYTDTKATIMGQMETISKEFKDGSGNPVIPPWAQAQHRSAMRSIAFKGMTGSAAIAASSNAIMEATLPIAESEAKFFQTLTTKNLDNRQASIINKAKTLASYDLANLQERSAAAVQNAKAFLQMDMENLDHEQEAEIINTAERVDAMFTDVAEENVARKLNIQNEMDNRHFYEQLQFDADRYNTAAINSAREANAGRLDTASQFNINRKMDRDKYEADMARYIDESNATWRRDVYKTNTRMEFEASALDVKNALDLTTEGMNKMWDRVDSQLEYIWNSTEADENRDFEIMKAQMESKAAAKSGKSSAIGSVVGAIAGGIFSDVRLKDNIEFNMTLPNGVNMYTWDWNATAKKLGADTQPNYGVLAQEIRKTHPEAVNKGKGGYLRVNYGKIK